MMSTANDDTFEGAVSFGPYRLYPQLRRLERDKRDVELGERAFDILCMLVARAGQVVSKRELVTGAWGSVVVGDGSLRLQINVLRKALGDDSSEPRYIRNVTGRGYCFIAPVAGAAGYPEAAATRISAPVLGKLPAQLARVVGRKQAVRDIIVLLVEWRFVSVVGPGGMGKTTVSLAAAHALGKRFHPVCFVDLGALRDARLVPSAVAFALGLMVPSKDPGPGLLAHLKERKALLILDSCDPVIEAVASLGERIFDECPHVAILCSCREPLRAGGEHVYPLPPLQAPPDSPTITAAQALTFSAVELFVARARAASSQFELVDSNAAAVAAISRALDGIPLALELAAGRVAALGLETIGGLLNSRFALSWRGRRTAPPRHRTLRAALAWSVELLEESERTTLMSLSVFAGAFTLEAAQAVAGSPDMDPVRIAETLARLVEKSLVSSMQAPRITSFWLLDTTRAYADELLTGSGHHAEVARRHAEFQCEFLERTYSGSTDFIEAEAWHSHAAYLSNLRAALEWTAAQPDLELLSRLAAAAGPFLLDLSLLDECTRWAARGLEALEESMAGNHREMELQASLGLSMMFARGITQEVRVALQRALELAQRLGDSYNQMRMLGALNLLHHRAGELHAALELARRAEEMAAGLKDPACSAMANWLLGISSHLVGNEVTGLELAEQALRRPPLSRLEPRVRFGFDCHRILCLCAWARCLFVLGYPDQARRAVARVVEEAGQLGHAVALGLALVWSTPILIWLGDWEGAQQAVDRLQSHALQNGFEAAHHVVGRGLQGHLLIERGECEAGLDLLQGFYPSLQATGYGVLLAAYSAPLAWGLAQRGRLEEALLTLDTQITRIEADGGSFDLAELFRVKAAILLTRAQGREVDAERLLSRSLEQARLQSALAWELRSATTFAWLRIRQGRVREAAIGLSAVYSRFKEGFQTADLAAARKLLDWLGSSNPAA
jgi:predicted ATPase/DNA-binding winged helix-turn-helix (wHTH) protein